MNIDLLSKMVKELILDSDCVALPGFGVFVAEIVPASFSDKGYTLNPPYRRLHFRARDVHDDALAALYAASNGVGLDVARKIVLDFTTELKKVLQKNKVVIFPGLGRLRATKENNFFFVPDEDLDIYPEGFGLEAISLKTNQETEEEVAAAVEDLAGILKDDTAGSAEDDSVQEVSPEPVQETVEDEQEEGDRMNVEAGEQQEVQETGRAVAAEREEEVAARTQKKRKAAKTVLIAVGAVIAVAALALLAFLVVAEACPDFMDSILYNKEELEILDRWENI